MQNVFIEATNGPQNWGEFMVARFDEEYERTSAVLERDIMPEMRKAAELVGQPPPRVPPMLRNIGWDSGNIIVLDLQTGEGARFRPGGLASADLMKHRIWVCPLFEPFLTWLYKQDLSDLNKLPKAVDLPDAPFEMYGHRRLGISIDDAKEFLRRKGYMYADMDKHPDLLVEFVKEYFG